MGGFCSPDKGEMLGGNSKIRLIGVGPGKARRTLAPKAAHRRARGRGKEEKSRRGKNKVRTKKIRSIVVELPKSDVILLNPESFLSMVNLEIFINRNAHFYGRVDYLRNSVRWIELGGRTNIHIKHTVVLNLQSNFHQRQIVCPPVVWTICLHFHPRYLVSFDVPYSGIRQLKKFKKLDKFTWMNLSGCEFLEKISDLSGSPNIKYLNLSDYGNLIEVDDFVGFLDKLQISNLYGCSKLTRFATRLGLKSLKRLWLTGCTRLEGFLEIEEDKMESLVELEIQRTGIRELPSSIAYLTGLRYLSTRFCENLTNINIYGCPKPITLTLSGLQALYLEGCNLSESDFLVPLDCCSTLTGLYLSRNNFVSLPDCISKFVSLEELFLDGCKRLRKIPQVLPPKLQLSGDEVAKLENNLLNAQVPSFFFLISVEIKINFVDMYLREISNDDCLNPFGALNWKFIIQAMKFQSGSAIPRNIPQILKKFGGDVIRIGSKFTSRRDVIRSYHDYVFRILINGILQDGPPRRLMWRTNDFEATHVWLKFLYLPKLKQQGDICQVIFRFPKSANIKSCGVHLLLLNQNKRLPLTLGPTSSLGKRWLSLSSEPADDHRKRRQIDLNVPTGIEEEEEQEQPSTSYEMIENF
ncbi:hypothetical protein DVH24_018272 [Malus domestica]|uniref:Disease resistance protein RPS4B/Roq1-like leucine-rich repeats domain-containing protein n=1 Tax=Malus domestica TaxID=3750 RepID=A0A498KD10_MALDO|nr:hypothetical protein DVH24_018272 [Malus domestica]